MQIYYKPLKGLGLKFSKYPKVHLDICARIITYKRQEIVCEMREYRNAHEGIPILIKYYLSDDSDTEEPSYVHDTGYTFEVRQITKENIEGWYDGNNLNAHGNFYLPTEAKNLKGYCQNTEDERFDYGGSFSTF